MKQTLGRLGKLTMVFSIVLLSRIFIYAQDHKKALPNVIIILADDMGYGDVSGLNPQAKTYTPYLDFLLAHGLSFTQAHASASVCTPSRYGLLTGRYAFRSEKAARGISGFHSSVFQSDRATLAHVFEAAGYQTACIGKWHLGLDWATTNNQPVEYDQETGRSNVDFHQSVKNGPNDFGFDYSFIHPASLDMPPYLFIRNQTPIVDKVWTTQQIYPSTLDETTAAWDKKHTKEGDVYWRKGVWWRKGEIAQHFKVEECLSEIQSEGINFIKKQAMLQKLEIGSPFFLYLPLTGPHTPWLPEKKYQGKSSVGDYGDFVLNIDGFVGEIYQTLVEQGIEENTILIFTSDNGAYWPEEEIALQGHESNWGSRGQKGDIWEGGHRVPFILYWPKQIATSRQHDELVSLTDLYATFKEMTGQTMHRNEGEDSFSFLSVLFGNKEATRHTMIHHSSRGMFAIRDREWKLIDGIGSGGFSPSETEVKEGEGQLYWISTDHIESNNYYQEKPTRVAELKEKLSQQKSAGRTRP